MSVKLRKGSARELPRWRVFRIGKVGQQVTVLRAASAEAAVARVAKEQGITDPHMRSRLMAHRV